MSGKKKLTIHVDGAARGNPGPAGAGGIIFGEEGKALVKLSEYLGKTTNNIAEYSALVLTLEKACELGAEEITVYSDSNLLVQQLNGLFKIKNLQLKSFFNRAKRLISSYSKHQIIHVEREKNAGADRLANEAIDGYLKGEKRETKIEGLNSQEKLF